MYYKSFNIRFLCNCFRGSNSLQNFYLGSLSPNEGNSMKIAIAVWKVVLYLKIYAKQAYNIILSSVFILMHNYVQHKAMEITAQTEYFFTSLPFKCSVLFCSGTTLLLSLFWILSTAFLKIFKPLKSLRLEGPVFFHLHLCRILQNEVLLMPMTHRKELIIYCTG